MLEKEAYWGEKSPAPFQYLYAAETPTTWAYAEASSQGSPQKTFTCCISGARTLFFERVRFKKPVAHKNVVNDPEGAYPLQFSTKILVIP